MKKFTFVSIISFALFALLSNVSIADAKPDNGHKHPKMAELTVEEQEALKDLHDEFLTKSEPIREKIRAKHIELDAITENPEADLARIESLSNEIAALGTELGHLRVELRKTIKEKFPNVGFCW